MNFCGKLVHTQQLYQIGYKFRIVVVAPIKHGRNYFVIVEKFKQYILVCRRQGVPENIGVASFLAAVYLVKPLFVFAAGFLVYSLKILFKFNDVKEFLRKIIDIAAVNFGFEEALLINIENAVDNGNRSSKVIAVKEHIEYPVTERPHDGRTGFKGWNSFSAIHRKEVYLAANIEDSPESAGLLRIFSDSITNYLGVDYCGNNHSMSVNCAVCFSYESREYIAAGSTERSVEILEAQNDGGTILYHLDGHDNGIHYIDIVNDDEIYAAHYSGEVSKWLDCGDRWRCMQVWAPHTFWVWECRYINVDGTGYIISCSYDKKISVINAETGEIIIMITEPQSRVIALMKYTSFQCLKIL